MIEHLKLKVLLIACCSASGLALASAGTLRSCEGISTSAGYKYVGTYCVDYECKFVVRKIFNEYCPYLLPNE